ncbi:hypothetical protein TNCV_1932891 [Trichonephila clavipes]|nr:hypothetical protein TNCV_1932891 [Trichonephila clavipes]
MLQRCWYTGQGHGDETWWKEFKRILMFCPNSVSNILWSSQQHAFAMDMYFSNGWLVIAEQRTFRRYFDIPPCGRVSDMICVLMLMDSFRVMENASKERNGPPKTVEITENVERVHLSIQIDTGQ